MDYLEEEEKARDWVYNDYSQMPALAKHKCPVCNNYLGERIKAEEKAFHCDDCRAWYTFYPNVTKPTAKLDKDMPNTCNCPGCQQRRS